MKPNRNGKPKPSSLSPVPVGVQPGGAGRRGALIASPRGAAVAISATASLLSMYTAFSCCPKPARHSYLRLEMWNSIDDEGELVKMASEEGWVGITDVATHCK